jgi:hypothetical protein
MSANQIRITTILGAFALTSLFGFLFKVDVATVFSVSALIIAADAWVLSQFGLALHIRKGKNDVRDVG